MFEYKTTHAWLYNDDAPPDPVPPLPDSSPMVGSETCGEWVLLHTTALSRSLIAWTWHRMVVTSPQDWKSVPLEFVNQNSRCIYCDSDQGCMVKRGNVFYGCTVCIGEFIKSNS
jgi:hypothetical protein